MSVNSSLTDSQMKSLTWMLLGNIRTNPNLRLQGYDLAQLKNRCKQLEGLGTPFPQTVEDWLAMALYGINRNHFIAACIQAQRENNPHYLHAVWVLRSAIEPND